MESLPNLGLLKLKARQPRLFVGVAATGSNHRKCPFCFVKMADKDIRVGILSTAAIVGKVLPGLKHGMKVIGVASRDRKRAQDFCDEHDCGEGMLYDEMLHRDDIDVLYIPLPTGLRNDKIALAIEKGKHIYSEKPMGGSVKELDALIKACKSKGLQWMDGTMWYHSLRTIYLQGKAKSPTSRLQLLGHVYWANNREREREKV